VEARIASTRWLTNARMSMKRNSLFSLRSVIITKPCRLQLYAIPM
jgi:hypothetical protein